MHHPPEPAVQQLAYSPLTRRWPVKAYLLGLVTLPLLYVVVYLLLRASGAYHPYFSQGSWEIEGTSHVYLLDVAYFPAMIIEGDIQNRLRWLREPSGG